MQPYKPRSIRFTGIETRSGFRVKLYTITHDDAAHETTARAHDTNAFAHETAGSPGDPADFADGISLAYASLPKPAQTPVRPGLAFLIAHNAASIDYIILAWWDRVNELPTRVFVREAGKGWREGRGSESFCVWDLQVIAHERDAYVRHMMAPDGPRPADYLADSEIAGHPSHTG